MAIYGDLDLQVIRNTRKWIELTCAGCNRNFRRRRKEVTKEIRNHPDHKIFCSRECYDGARGPITMSCSNCGKSVVRRAYEIRDQSKSGRVFCDRSCAAKYNNIHKTTGTRRAKLEIWMENQLRTMYPDLAFVFNGTNAIDAELDIFVPDLALAFELNGIYHYEPVHGSNRLASIQANDQRKFRICHERGISLCVIDTTGMRTFKPVHAQIYLDIVTRLLNDALTDLQIVGLHGVEP